jgi:CBS domain-containing protein
MTMNKALLSQGHSSSVGMLPRRSTTTENRGRLTDPAVSNMNDFTREYPVTVSEERQIDAALGDMILVGVRALLVVRDLKVLGLITSYDIEGERPIQYMQRYYVNRKDVQVGHVMTLWADLPTLSWQAIQHARVADVLEVFRETNVMHLLVVETVGEAADTVRGLFSKTRIERHLGYLPATNAATSHAASAPKQNIQRL